MNPKIIANLITEEPDISQHDETMFLRRVFKKIIKDIFKGGFVRAIYAYGDCQPLLSPCDKNYIEAHIQSVGEKRSESLIRIILAIKPGEFYVGESEKTHLNEGDLMVRMLGDDKHRIPEATFKTNIANPNVADDINLAIVKYYKTKVRPIILKSYKNVKEELQARWYIIRDLVERSGK